MSEEIVDVVIPYSKKYTEDFKLERAKDSAENHTVEINLIVCEDNVGPAFGRNQGLEKSDNRFVAFLDADDEWEPKKLEKQIRKLKDTGKGICLTDVDLGNEIIRPSRTTEEQFVSDILTGELYSLTSSIIIDTSKIDITFDEDLYRYEDHKFIIECVYSAGICFVEETLTKVNKHSGGLSSKEDSKKKIRDKEHVAKLAGKFYPDLKPLIEDHLSKKFRRTGIKYQLNSQRSLAFTYYLRSLSYSLKAKTFLIILSLLLPTSLSTYLIESWP